MARIVYGSIIGYLAVARLAGLWAIVIVKPELQIAGTRNRNHQRQRIRFQVLDVLIGIALSGNVGHKAARLQRRDHHEDDQHHQQDVD